MNPMYTWLILIAVFSILESVTYQFISIWFVLGSLVAFIVGLCGGTIHIQIAAFFIVSVLALICSRPFTKKFFSKREATNSDRILGQVGTVMQEINNLKPSGEVRVLAQLWSARSNDESIIEKNSQVKILRIEGVKVIVERLK